MSKIQLRNDSERGGHRLIIDGRDVSEEVLADAVLQIVDQEARLTVTFAVDDLDVDIEADVDA